MAAYRFDPELAAALPLLIEVDATDVAALRVLADQMTSSAASVDTTGVTVYEERVPGIDGAPDTTARVYRAERSTGGCILDLHNGGYILGRLAFEEGRNVVVARELGVTVVSVNYRLAPEHRFPAALQDCHATLVWVAENAAALGVDPSRIVVRGASAGGGLGAALTLLVRDRGGPPIRFQFLSVPALDDRLGTDSMTRYVDTPIWNRANACASWESYLGPGVPGSETVPALAAPARASDLSGLPPAYISLMQFDPLRDEGLEYARRLMAAGIQVELHIFPGTFHGSTMVENAEVTQRELTEELDILRRVLASGIE